MRNVAIAIGAGGAAFVAIVVVTVVHITGGGDQQCSLPAPVPSLNAQLRALGGFDQAYDPQNRQLIEMVAEQAASAAAPRLIGATADAPVPVASRSSQRPDALIVPLTGTTPGDAQPHVTGLVAFLRDCSGRAYYSGVEDLSASGRAAQRSFPAVSERTAAQRLGTDDPALVYASNPFAPAWVNRSDGGTTPAQ